ncbi:DNA topoisomerase I [Methanoplanus limicola]|uniref:DNA topoisomerase 1 n=1 Tax=Methanoplanus limicola DSM 2279 TaxID=937775 RepID=H1Z3S2_9EURY|nr:DNA topoisomerase I [Methanoplanus limicola]EHQ35671.1 DNA topoisomerase I [Methanoplanus limicola DSM 2279]
MHLIIAEKNIAAQRIAGFLSSSGKPKTEKDNNVSIYRFDDKVALGLRGHVVEVDFEEGYKNWRSETHTPRTLIDAGIIRKPTEKKIVALIKKLSKKADLVTIATDYDREGELIGKEAYEIVREANKKVPVNRARFSAITKQEISAAFDNPAEIDFDLAAAGEARQEIDLVWGASLTRFISIAAKRGGKNILSVGRVQSPTLAMIVDREKEIGEFVPVPYWMLSIISEKDKEQFEARHTHGRFDLKEEAESALSGTKEPVEVTEKKEGSRTDKAPAPFDTTGYIVAASRLGLSASNAMRVAEDLYMNGYISYPRTDNTVYPDSLDIKGILNEIKKSFRRDTEWVIANIRDTPTKGKKTSTDHPPIHPTGAAKPADLDEKSWKVYELIVRRFLATLSPDARWKTLKYLLNAGGEEYTSTGQRLEYEGYRMVYPYSQAKEQVLPDLSEGEKLPLVDTVLEEKETQPPPRYSQSKLIQQMEELGLGTKSTRHEVIGKLISRRYVEDNPLKPTQVGMAVTESLEKHATLITKPDMTKTIEDHMEEIKRSSRSKEEAVNESRGMLNQIFDDLEKNEEAIGEEIMDRTAEERIVGKCPVCNSNLMIRTTKGMAQFVGCTNYPDCSFNLNLPSVQWGKAIRDDDNICDQHNLHHVKLIRAGARPWEIGCPLCNHIRSNIEALEMMDSVSPEIIRRMHENHIYSVFEISKLPVAEIASKMNFSDKQAFEFKKEAEGVLEELRKRSEVKKFVRKTIPPKKGRSHSKVSNGLFSLGITDLGRLSCANKDSLKSLKLNDEEAEKLIFEAKLIHNKGIFKEVGIPAISVNKYFKAGFIGPNDLSTTHPAYLSYKSGINIDTVHKHVSIICENNGIAPPAGMSRKTFEKGRTELMSLKSFEEEMLEKMYYAGVLNFKTLIEADADRLAKITGITRKKIMDFKKEAENNK